jgi:hypothetical protein
MAEHELCPNCGSRLPVNAPQGLCPACLLRQALESDDPAVPIPPAKDDEIPRRSPIDGGACSGADRPPASSGPDRASRSHEPESSDADTDATLSYSIVREGGKVEPLLSAQDLEQLARTFTPGMVLQGRYVLERELGRGAMGLVFLGRDNRLDRPVAIKAILPGESGWRARGPATEQQFRNLFLHEAKLFPQGDAVG